MDWRPIHEAPESGTGSWLDVLQPHWDHEALGAGFFQQDDLAEECWLDHRVLGRCQSTQQDYRKKFPSEALMVWR